MGTSRRRNARRARSAEYSVQVVSCQQDIVFCRGAGSNPWCLCSRKRDGSSLPRSADAQRSSAMYEPVTRGFVRTVRLHTKHTFDDRCMQAIYVEQLAPCFRTISWNRAPLRCSIQVLGRSTAGQNSSPEHFEEEY